MEELIVTWSVFQTIADLYYDGHFTILKFTTNYRAAFGTKDTGCREMIEGMQSGTSLKLALQEAVREFDQTHGTVYSDKFYNTLEY